MEELVCTQPHIVVCATERSVEAALVNLALLDTPAGLWPLTESSPNKSQVCKG